MNNFGYRFSKIWAQSAFELSKSSWNSFDVNPRRVFRDTFNAEYHTVLTFDIVGSEVSRSLFTINATWFAKNVTDGSSCLASNVDIDLLRSKIKNGSAIPTFGSLFIREDEQVITGERINSLGHRYMVSKYPVYHSIPYWYFERISSDGFLYVLRWKVGLAVKKKVSHQVLSDIWCTDDCWIKISTIYQLAKELHGSTTQLAQALRSGHQLRVYISGVATPTKSVYIHGQTISACLEDIMEPIGVTEFNSSGTAQRKIVSSNGQVQTRRYTFETDSILEELQEQQDIDWFVDTREWSQVLSVTGDGQNLSGSVADLREKVLMGVSVRIVVEFSDRVLQIVDADHLEVSSAGHVAAEIIYHANIQFGENYNITFTAASSHHLWSAIITTEGDFNKYLYTYKKTGGQHETLSSNVYRYTWFVQM